MNSPRVLSKLAENGGWWPFRDGRDAARVSAGWVAALVVVQVAGFGPAVVAFPLVLSVAGWRNRRPLLWGAVRPWWWLLGARSEGARPWSVPKDVHKVMFLLGAGVAAVTAVTYCLAAAAHPVQMAAGWGVLLAGLAVHRKLTTTPRAGTPANMYADPAKYIAGLRNAGLLKAVEKDGTPVHLPGVAGSYAVAEDGTRVVHFVLPDGVSVSAVIAARAKVLAGMRFPDPAGRVDFDAWHDLEHHLRVTFRPAPIVLHERAPVPATGRWGADPVVARNAQTGADVRLPMHGFGGTLVTGMTGMGKTWFVRVIIAWVMGIPGATYVLLDGKYEKRKDWWFIRHAADRYVSSDGVSGPADVMAALEKACADLEARRADDDDNPPPYIVHFEEYAGLRNVLARADKDLRQRYGGTVGSLEKAFDRLVMELVQRGRSQNFHSIITTQQPNAGLIPTAIRDQLGGRLAFHQPSPSTVMTFGRVIDQDDLPTMFEKGYAVMAVEGGGLVKVYCDSLDNTAWEAFCAALPDAVAVDVPAAPQDSASAAPAPEATPAASAPQAPTGGRQDAPDAPAPAGPPPLFWAALAIVRAHGEPMVPGALYTALPLEVRPATLRGMGDVLAEHGWRSAKNARIGGVRVRAYRLEDAGTLVGQSG